MNVLFVKLGILLRRGVCSYFYSFALFRQLSIILTLEGIEGAALNMLGRRLACRVLRILFQSDPVPNFPFLKLKSGFFKINASILTGHNLTT